MFDEDTKRLWMSWGGHSGFLSEVDASTGKLIDPATGISPPSTEFDTHSKGVHSKILTNQPWTGKQTKVDYSSLSEAPMGWEGDAFSSQAYVNQHMMTCTHPLYPPLV